MQNTTLNIYRKKSFVGAAMPYRVFLNGKEIAKVKNGEKLSVVIPAEQAALKVSMVGNAITFHRIEKEVVVFPKYSVSHIINCEIETKANWLGIISYGLFAATGHILVDLKYC